MEELKQLNIKFDALVEARRELYNKNQAQKKKNNEVLEKIKGTNTTL